MLLFSSPELKAQVIFSNHLSSVCPSVCLYTFHIFIYFSRTIEPISTKLGTKHPWVKGIQVCSNEGPRPFPRGDNYEIVKIHWRNLKIFSRTTEPISTKLGTKHPWVKGIQVCSKEEPINSHKVNNFFSDLNQGYDKIICVNRFDLFSQVSDVAHGPLVYHWFSCDKKFI